MKKVIAIYSIIIGASMIGVWTYLFNSTILSEGKISLGFHLYAEFATATTLMVSGILLIKNARWDVMTNMGGLGMLTYSTINTAGYYGQNGNYNLMILFIVLAVMSIFAICGHYYSSSKNILKN